MAEKFVAILMGSDSDLPIMQHTIDVLDKFAISREVRVTSAHRTPTQTRDYVVDAEKRGCKVFIAGAGMAAHLAGAVAAYTMRPVIGVPIEGGTLDGLDALLSTAQMPGGVPVATVAIGKAGAKNAAYLAAQILATSDDALHELVKAERAENARGIMAKNDALQAQLNKA